MDLDSINIAEIFELWIGIILEKCWAVKYSIMANCYLISYLDDTHPLPILCNIYNFITDFIRKNDTYILTIPLKP